jgi:hypothetical protein
MDRIHSHDLLRWIHDSRVAAMGTDRAEVRSLSFVVMTVFLAQLVEAGFYIGFIDESLTYKVATLSALGGRLPLAIAFFGAASMLVPHLVALAFFPDKLGCQWPRALAARAGIVGAASWGLMAYLSSPLDYEWLTTVYGTRAMVDLWLAVLFGLSLNAQQARERIAVLTRRHQLHEQSSWGRERDR